MSKEEYAEIMDKSNFMIDSANPYDMKIKEALEKQIPQKVADDGMRIPFSYYCPNCFAELSDDGYKDEDAKYCYKCGQKLKWE